MPVLVLVLVLVVVPVFVFVNVMTGFAGSEGVSLIGETGVRASELGEGWPLALRFLRRISIVW